MSADGEAAWVAWNEKVNKPHIEALEAELADWRRKAGREGVRANDAEEREEKLREALQRWLACSFEQMRMERGKGHCPHTVAFGGEQEMSCMMLAEAALSEGEG